jgi:hypothetical protein
LFIYFSLPVSKHSQYLKIQPSEYVGFPYGKREGKGRGNYPLRERTILLSVILSTPAWELLNGISYAG